ncbi:LacI family DNA-binding transcriptional regulator [Actinoplanes sp. NPDC051633]|uniref:LacI family DNA-binding transcriptional regulator n=1 Tax=Actinoplanes sp. NPDC051633 TaxID=3155670 RepID=UPI00342F79F7
MTSRLAAVAAYAGVSEATVSRVLHDKPGVARATRDAVLTALDVFGFPRPRPVRGERARLIGLVLPDLSNPVFPAFADVIGVSLAQRGLVPVLCTRTSDGVSEAHYIQMLLASQVGGIIFVGSSFADAGDEQARQLTERRLPMVLINAADENLGVPQVGIDERAAVEQAVGHLTGLGHERIGLILGPWGHVPSMRKLVGFKRSQDLVEHTVFSMEGGRAAALRLLDRGVTGLVCASDALALGAIRAVRRKGLSVPGDVSVVGFDDSAFMGVTDPPLTTMRQPVREMAAAAVSSLLAQLDGRLLVSDEITFDPELIVRATTAPCAAMQTK